MSEWIIRPYRGGDGAAINRSFNRVFGCHRSDEEWEWKFLDRPLGPFIMVAVGPEGEVLAQYAAVPVRLQTPVGVVWAGQVVDVFSLPSVRQGLAAGKAYLQAMALFFARWGNPDHLALLFGFPSQRPLKLGQLTGRYAQVPAQPVIQLRKTAPEFAGSRLGYRVVPGIAPLAVECLWQEQAHRFPYAAVRDGQYIRWRYLRRPSARYAGLTLYRGDVPHAALIFRQLANSSLALVDWVTPPDPAVWQALLAAVLRLVTGSVRSMEAWLTGDTETERALTALGFVAEPHPAVTLAVRLFHPALDPASVPGAFFTTWGDTDLI